MANEVADFITHMKDEVYPAEYIDLYELSSAPKNPLAQVIPIKGDGEIDFFGVKVTNFIIIDGPYTNIDSASVTDAKNHLTNMYEQFAAYKTFVIINTEGDKYKCMNPTSQETLETTLEAACSGLTSQGVTYKGKMNPGAIKSFIQTELTALFGDPPT